MDDFGVPPEIALDDEGESKGLGGKIAGIFLSKPFLCIVGLAIGAAGMHFAGAKLGLTSPTTDTTSTTPSDPGSELNQLRAQVQGANAELEKFTSTVQSVENWQSTVNELNQYKQLYATVEQLQEKLSDQMAQEEAYDKIQEGLVTARKDSGQLTEHLDHLKEEVSLLAERKVGLDDDVDRLEELVGALTVANDRRLKLRKALNTELNLMGIHLQESLPWSPPEYRLQDRIMSINEMQDELDNSQWVTPELIHRLVDAARRELELSRKQRYFIARISVPDKKSGGLVTKSAELIADGSRTVFFRTLDGKTTGELKDTSTVADGFPVYKPDFSPSAAVAKYVTYLLSEFRTPASEEYLAKLREEDKKIAGAATAN